MSDPATAALRERYVICPQLAEYDRLPQTLAPYLTFTSPRNHRSAVVNTDVAGFRVSRSRAATIDTGTWPGRGPGAVLLGSSFVFGVGATSDAGTLASHLSGMRPQLFMNLGVRAGNSTQELVAAIPFLERAECIVVCSGINNLLVNLQSLGLNELFGPFFAEGTFELLRGLAMPEVARLIAGHSSAAGLRTLIVQYLRRLRSRTAAAPLESRRQTADSASAGHESLLARALAFQRRDLRILAAARRPDSTMLFAAQPFAPCCAKPLSTEERSLFDIHDRWDPAGWRVVTQTLPALWPRYVSAMQQICEDEQIAFVDLGKHDLSGWAFVDRVHMTDAGYLQIAECLAGELARC